MTIAPDRSRGTGSGLPDQVQVSPWRGHGRGAGAARDAAGSATTDSDRIDRPRLADGVDLVGEYEGSGYKEPHHLARRSNGALIQLTDLLHLVASAADGRRSHAEIAEEVSRSFGRTVSEDNVRLLVEDKLRPLGVLAGADGSSPEVPPADPLLGLKLRCTLLSARAVRAATTVFRPLFAPVLVVPVLVALAAFDVWLFLIHGLAQSLRQTIEAPLVFLLVIGAVVVSAALHEMGHAAACRYGGAEPGRMGAGLYVAWPAFYTDVTDAYRLDRKGRLRTDLGGVYFNAITVLVTAAVFAATRYEPLLLVCFVLQMQIVQQMLPLLRLDGYYVLSDLVGVPDLFKRIGPILRSALPWRGTDPLVSELKPHVRVVVALWVLAVVPLLLLNLAFLLAHAPRILATAWDSAARQWGVVTSESGLALVVGVIQLVVLLIPTIGAVITTVRVGRRAATGAWSWSSGSPGRRFSVLGGAGLLATLLVLAWWPDGSLTPYRKGESGTVQQGVTAISGVGRGTPELRSPQDLDRDAARPSPTPSATSEGPVPDTASSSSSVTQGTATGGTDASGSPTAAPGNGVPSTATPTPTESATTTPAPSQTP